MGSVAGYAIAHTCANVTRRRITGGKVTERHTGRRGRERERKRERGGEGDPHSTPSLPTRTLLYALHDPRGGEHRDYRLPPTFSRGLSISLLSSFYSICLSTSPSFSLLSRTLVPKLLLPVPAAPASLLSFPSLLSLFPPLYACPQCLRCTSALTSTNSRRLARKRRRHKRIFTPRR